MLRIVLLMNIIITLSCLGICCHAWMVVAPSPSCSVRHTIIHMKKQLSDEDEFSSLPIIPPRPPMPFRDESSFVLAGDVSSSDESSPVIRQSPSSINPLLSPPRKVSNPYGWMRDESRTNETILNHLHAENDYCERMMSHLEELREELYHELLSSIQETDYTTPALKTSPIAGGIGYWYYTRYEKGQSYARYCRAPQSSPDEMYPPSINKDWNESYIDVINNTTLWGHLLPNEIVYLDMPILAHNKTSYLVTNTIAISPNEQYVAYTLDESGGEVYQLYVKHIQSNKVYTIYNTETMDEALQCDGSVVWNNANDVLFYVTQDNTTKRSHKLYSRRIFNSTGHWIDTCDQVDVLLLEEEDGSFNVRIAKTFDGRYLLIRLSSKESSEVHYLDLKSDDVKDEQEMSRTANHNLVCIAKRAHKVLYRVTHCQGYWLVQTNIGGLPNLSLKACRVGKDGMENWKDVVINNNDVPSIPVFSGGHERSLDGVTVFHPSFEEAKDPNHSPPLAYAIITGREDGMPRVWALELSVKDGTNDNDDISTLTVTSMTRLEFDEDAYDVGIGGVRDPCLPYVVISYDSLITPPSHIAVPLSRPSELSVRKVLKVKTVPGYNKDSYACERTTVKSRDGKTDIPVSLVYHRDVLTDRSGPIHPVHLYGYGSYGASIEASFRSTRLPLLKRGFVYVLAHVRGGGELGRPWYDDAKFLAKKNSFNDFIDVALWLVDDSINANDTIESTIGRGITRPSKLSCEGQSAGGLLVGASLNQRPDLFRAAILGVPFVDVTCTMIDSTIPLTIAEWSEWGNPNEEKYFDYITSYSPINNVKDGSVYPTCLITGGFNDPRVSYWEPAKYCAELRHKISDESGPVLLKMNMDSGHSSGSDRYKYFRDFAFDYAFLLDALSS